MPRARVLVDLVRGQRRRIPKARRLRVAALRVPGDRLLVETDAPFLSPQPVRGKPQPAGLRRPHRAGARGRATGAVRGARRGAVEAEARRRCSDGQARAELPRRPQHPRRDRAAGGAGGDDVVLEVGGGPGVLSERLAFAGGARPRRRARPSARGASFARCSRRPTMSRCTSPTRSSWTSARWTRRRRSRREPPVRRRRDRGAADARRAPRGERWVVMVQREVGERLAAGPGSGAYGARRCSRSWPPRFGCCARSRGPCSDRCRTSTRCWSG